MIGRRKHNCHPPHTPLKCKTLGYSLPGQAVPINELMIVPSTVPSTDGSIKASKRCWRVESNSVLIGSTKHKRGRVNPQCCYLGLHLVSCGTLVLGAKWGLCVLLGCEHAYTQATKTSIHIKLQLYMHGGRENTTETVDRSG